MEQRKRAPLSLWRIFGYSSGAAGYEIVDRVIVAALMYFYVPPEGGGDPVYISAKVFGFIFLFGRIVDSVADPLVSYWTDRFDSRWGRRVPFILTGAIPLALSSILIFYPPFKGMSPWNAVYVAALLASFFFFFTYYVCPYLALLPELTVTQHDRINLTTYKGLFMLLGTIIGTVFWAPLADSFGYKTMAIMLGVPSALLMMLPAIAINEKKYCVSKPCGMDMITSLTSTLKNKPFVVYLVGNITFWFGFNVISSGATYYITVLLDRPLNDLMYYMAVVFAVSIVFMPVVNLMCKAMGKRKTIITLLGMFVVLLPAVFFLNAPWLPISKDIACYILMGLIGIPLSGLFVVPDGIVSDLTDYDEMLTGERHEAMYFGAQGFFLKVNMGISTVIMTWMFSTFGNSVARPLGVQLTGPFAGLFALIGMLAFLLYYPDDIEKKVEKFRLEKERARD